MASKGSVYSQTLHDITITKLEELSKKRASFEAQRERINALVEQEQDDTKKLAILATDMKACFSIPTSDGRIVRRSSSNPRLEIDLNNLDRFLSQAKYDPSVTSKILQQWQQTLLRHFEAQSVKFAYASLYGQLTTEWLSSDQGPAPTSVEEDAEMKDFEHVPGGKKLESRRKWEESVFRAVDVDQSVVTGLLHGLFEATPDDSKHLLKALVMLRIVRVPQRCFPFWLSLRW